MTLRLTRELSATLLKDLPIGLLAPSLNYQNYQSVRYRRAKHWNPKFRLLRKLKVIKVELPEYNKDPNTFSEEEVRSRMKERGLLPSRPWQERSYFISSTGGVFEGYVPPEGDGKVSLVTAQGAKQNLQFLEKKTKSMMAIRKMRTFDEEFETSNFCKEAEDIYKKAHEYMATKDTDKLKDFVTERAYPEVIHNIFNKTIRWKFINNIEPPRVVHARCTDIITKENVFAQLTVRFHTQQALAIYDRFGRLMHGSEILAKDVLEYIVFEKHIANEYGTWRIHAKIIPDWLPPKEPSSRTYKKMTKDDSKREEKSKVDNVPQSSKEINITSSTATEKPSSSSQKV